MDKGQRVRLVPALGVIPWRERSQLLELGAERRQLLAGHIARVALARDVLDARAGHMVTEWYPPLRKRGPGGVLVLSGPSEQFGHREAHRSTPVHYVFPAGPSRGL